MGIKIETTVKNNSMLACLSKPRTSSEITWFHPILLTLTVLSSKEEIELPLLNTIMNKSTSTSCIPLQTKYCLECNNWNCFHFTKYFNVRHWSFSKCQKHSRFEIFKFTCCTFLFLTHSCFYSLIVTLYLKRS